MASTKTRNLGRISEIAQVAVKHGFGYFFERHASPKLLQWKRAHLEAVFNRARGMEPLKHLSVVITSKLHVSHQSLLGTTITPKGGLKAVECRS